MVDFDRIEASNLHRQTIYTVADIGAYKAEVAASYISERNPNCDISAITECLDVQSIHQLCEQHNIVLDCTDDQAFSRVLNAVCLFNQKKAVFANAASKGAFKSAFIAYLAAAILKLKRRSFGVPQACIVGKRRRRQYFASL